MRVPICSPSVSCSTRWQRDSTFKGESSGAVFNEILHQDPVAVVRLNTRIPPELERLIEKGHGEGLRHALPERGGDAGGLESSEA